MNKFYLLLVLAACSISINAQHHKLNMPLGNISNSSNQTTFTPKTINFTSGNPVSHDGLRATSRDNNKAILIKGTPLTQERSGNEILDLGNQSVTTRLVKQ